MRTLLYTMEQYGIALSLDGDQLKARIPPGYPAYLKDLLRSRKSEFIAALLEQHQPEQVEPPADLTDDDRGVLIQMGLRWSYTPDDWDRLWSACRDQDQRAAWLATAETEQPPTPDTDGPEPVVTVRIEGNFGAGRKQFGMRIPAHRWSEQRFAELVSKLPDARWWRLGQPRTCASCRHAQATQHQSLVRCDQRNDAPACGYWWQDDLKPCSAWAPTSRTDTSAQTQETAR